ncbi:Acetylcholine receptor subunit alpha-like 1 [Gryllus bimaculatus]|nr:Acetylcholine receptor subunit alpha-like 1 [Gryllus bimaculatus]
MTFRHVDLDELRSIMTVHGWVKMSWIDEKLKWSESEWGGLGVLHIADHEIWQPDIVLYNSATGNTIDHYGNTHCLVYPNGEVLWVPPSQFIVFCALDLRRWPFDEQTCHLRLGSWTYDGEQVELQLGDRGAEIELMETNSEWEVVRVTERRNVKVYACCDEPYIDVTYNVTVRRRSPTYSALVLTPATVIVLMTLSVFWLPPTAGEKLLLSCTTALIICLFLLYFSQQLPAMAGHTPLIGAELTIYGAAGARTKSWPCCGVKIAAPLCCKNVVVFWLSRHIEPVVSFPCHVVVQTDGRRGGAGWGSAVLQLQPVPGVRVDDGVGGGAEPGAATRRVAAALGAAGAAARLARLPAGVEGPRAPAHAGRTAGRGGGGAAPRARVRGPGQASRAEAVSRICVVFSKDEAPPAGPSRAAAAARDWLLLATAVDRVAFLAYCLLFGVLAAVYAV